MKGRGFLYFVLLALFIFTASGCLSVSNSPAARFHSLSLAGSLQMDMKLNKADKLIIEIGPVEIPEYQNRPQIVTRDKSGLLVFAQFERWGETLDLGLERLILENLNMMFPQTEFQMFPCNFVIPLDYQVVVNVVQLESRLDKDVFFAAQWTIIDSKNKTMRLTKRFQIRQAISPHTYAGLAEALSKAATALSVEIAENLTELLK